MGSGSPQVWGRQQPFERNLLQRTLTVFALGAVLAVTVVLLVNTDATDVIGIASICLGLLCALAAVSRHRYVRETVVGFTLLRSRDGRFVIGTALQLVITALFVVVLIVT
ncbi:MAG: hypothetical protein L0H96_00180 [Humibacillus sp.]|nr:hypothetical protein [Humibacillus sp.]MDN5775313.1 hypothetical protein [Humibacillus sp.]